MWIANLNVFGLILFGLVGDIVFGALVTVIILFIADVIEVIKRRCKK